MKSHVEVQSEKIVAIYDSIVLEGKGKVKLTITDKRIFAEKRASMFSKRLTTVMDADFGRIVNVEQHGEASIKVSHTADLRTSTAVFTAQSKSQSLALVNYILDRLFENKKKLEEDAKRKQNVATADVLFTAYLLESMLGIWAIVTPLHKIMTAIREREWEKAEVHASIVSTVANELGKNSDFDLDSAIRAFSDAVKSRSPENVNTKVSELLSKVGSLAGSSAPASKKWAQYSRDANLNWLSISYFLLFALSVNELLLSLELDKAQDVEGSVSKIKKLLPIMEAKVGKYLTDCVSELLSNKSFPEISSRVSDILSSELQKSLGRVNA